MKPTHFFKGLSWLLLLNLLIKPVWIFLIDRQVQNIVGAEAYGSYFALFNLTYVLLFVADAGLSNMLIQRLSANGKLNLRQLLQIKIVLLLLYAFVCFAVAAIAGITQWNMLGLLVLTQSLNSLFLFFRSLLAARQLFKTDALFSVLDKTLLLLLCIAPVYGLFFHITILRFLQLQVLSTMLAVGGLAFFLLRKKAFSPGERTGLKNIRAWVAPFVLILLFMSAHNRLDAFLLERMHPDGARQAGIYAMAYRLLDAGNMVGYLTASFLVPFLSRNQSNKKAVQQVVLITRHGLLLLAAIVVAFALVFAPWLQAVLYHSTAAYNNTVIRLCLAVLPAYYLIHVYGSALTAAAAFRPFLRILVFAVCLNVAMNAWLIPLYGAVGCCIAALVSQYACGAALWFAAARYFPISPAAKSALLYPATALLCGGLFFLGQKLTLPVWIILSSIALMVMVPIVTRRSLRQKLLSFYK